MQASSGRTTCCWCRTWTVRDARWCRSRPTGQPYGTRGIKARLLVPVTASRGEPFKDRRARGSRLCVGLVRDPAQVWRRGGELFRHRREASPRGGHGGELCSGRPRAVHGCTHGGCTRCARTLATLLTMGLSESLSRVRRLGRIFFGSGFRRDSVLPSALSNQAT